MKKRKRVSENVNNESFFEKQPLVTQNAVQWELDKLAD